MTRWIFVLLFAAGCASGAEVPDDLPPPPPAMKGEPVLAPVLEEEAEAASDGFGESSFDEAPAPTTAEATDSATSEEEPSAEEDAAETPEAAEASSEAAETGEAKPAATKKAPKE